MARRGKGRGRESGRGRGRGRGRGHSPAQDSVVEDNAVMAMQEGAVNVCVRGRPRRSERGGGRGGGRSLVAAPHEEEAVAVRSRGRTRGSGRSGARGRGCSPAVGSHEDDGATPIDYEWCRCTAAQVCDTAIGPLLGCVLLVVVDQQNMYSYIV